MTPKNILLPDELWILLASVKRNRSVFHFLFQQEMISLVEHLINYSDNSYQDAIFRVVAAILHLGNVEFAKGKEIDSSVLKDDKSRFHLDATAELLRYVLLTCLISISIFSLFYIFDPGLTSFKRCDAKSLEDALIKRVMVTPEEVITRTLDPDSATGSRDALAKTIYSRLFDWYTKNLPLFKFRGYFVFLFSLSSLFYRGHVSLIVSVNIIYASKICPRNVYNFLFSYTYFSTATT